MSDDYQLRKDIDKLKLMVNDDGSDVVTTEKVDEILTDYVNQSEFNDTIESLQDGLVINIEDTVLENSDYPVKSSGIYNAIHNHNHDFQQVLAFDSWNSTYINSAWAVFYKSNNLVLVRYNITTKSLGTATANKVISNNNLPSDLIPAYTSQNIVNTASSSTNILFTINTSGQLILYPYSANQTVNIAGYLMYLANTDEVEVDSVVLSSSSQSIEVNNALTLSATVTGDDSNPMVGKTVTFYNGETSLGTAPTDSSGIATITYTPLSKGTLSLKAVCDEVESSVVSVTVTDNRATTVSVTTDYSTYTIGDTVNITVSATDSDSEPSVNRSVYFNGSVVGTTNRSGVYTETKTYNTSGSKTLTYTIDGVSSSASITVNKVSTTTTLATSGSPITIGNTFTLSGTVSVGSSGLSVKLYKNNVLLDTLTTTSGGAFSTTLTASTVGTDSYYVEYEGDTTYASSTSNTVNVQTILKIPSISIVGGGTITQGSTSYFTGVLSYDGTGLGGKTVELWDLNGATPISSTTTLSDGSYSLVIPTSTVGNYTYYTAYNGDSTTYDGAVSSDVSVSIVSSVSVGDITLTGTKSILSHYDSEYSDITATVYDDSATPQPMANQQVVFKKGSTVLDTLTTDNNGECTYRYSSAGVGDVTITAECSTVDDTYTIEDCEYYNDGGHTTGLIIDSGVSCTVDNGAIKISKSTSGEKYVKIPITHTSSNNFSYEFEIPRLGVYQYIAGYLNAPSSANGLWFAYTTTLGRYEGSCTNSSINYSTSFNAGDKIKIEQNNGVISLYHNGYKFFNKTQRFSGNYYFGFYTNSNRTQYLKDIKVKPL